MKVTASAGELADALALADALTSDQHVKRIAALAAVQLVAGRAGFAIGANVLDHALTLTLPATVEAPGALALPCERLAALAAGCPRDRQIEIAAAGTGASVVCGRSRFRLPAIPQEDLPAPPALDAETGRVELAREEALKLFAQPLFAVATDQTRYYLNGIFLHDADGGLAGAATDGHRLCRVVIPGAAGLAQDKGLIVPRVAVKIILKLLADKSCERIMLRRSAHLFAVEAARFAFVSKLIDAEFPAYQCLIPQQSSGNVVTVARSDFALALDRVAAVVDPGLKAHMRVVGLEWAPDEPGALHLRIPGHNDLADDIVDAEVVGAGKTAVQIRHLHELLDELVGERIRIDSSDPGAVILITDPSDPDVLVAQMPCRWAAQLSQAA